MEPDVEMVARRIVMRRDVWDEIIRVTDGRRESTGVDWVPSEIATLAIEVGILRLATMLSEQTKKKPRKAKK